MNTIQGAYISLGMNIGSKLTAVVQKKMEKQTKIRIMMITDGLCENRTKAILVFLFHSFMENST